MHEGAMWLQTTARLRFPITRYGFAIFLQQNRKSICFKGCRGGQNKVLTLNSIWRKLQCTLRHLPSFQKEQTVSQPKAEGSWRKLQLSPWKYINEPLAWLLPPFSYLSASWVVVEITIVIFPRRIHVCHFFEEIIDAETWETSGNVCERFWGYVPLLHIFLKIRHAIP